MVCLNVSDDLYNVADLNEIRSWEPQLTRRRKNAEKIVTNAIFQSRLIIGYHEIK
jgi:hypothetical protein